MSLDKFSEFIYNVLYVVSHSHTVFLLHIKGKKPAGHARWDRVIKAGLGPGCGMGTGAGNQFMNELP